MIHFQDVSLQYHYEQYPLFKQLTFDLTEGVNTVLCDVQSGKTSLCKLLLGQIVPTSGQIFVDSTPLSKQNRLDALYLPSNPTFFVHRSVLFNLQYPSKVRKIPCDNDNILQLAQQFCLVEKLKTKVKKLDPTQQKQLALARGLTVPRQVVLIDGFFDDNLSQIHLDQVEQHFQTVVLFTDDATQAIGHTVVLDGGECIFQGDSQQAQQVIASLTWLADKIRS